MAKKCVIYRNIKREKIIHKKKNKRNILKKNILKKATLDNKLEAINKLSTRKRDESICRVVNRCNVCGRSHSVYRKFKLCRICLRNNMVNGLIPGLKKASW